MSDRSSDCYRFDGDHHLICLNGKTAREESRYNGRNPRAKSNKYHIVDNCRRCKYKALCFAPVKNKKAFVRAFDANEEMYLYKKEAHGNLLSIEGIEMRVNRSSQIEARSGSSIRTWTMKGKEGGWKRYPQRLSSSRSVTSSGRF